jgi:hypothetical protein
MTLLNSQNILRRILGWMENKKFELMWKEFCVGQCFSGFVRPRIGKYIFIRRGPGPNKFTRKYLSIF